MQNSRAPVDSHEHHHKSPAEHDGPRVSKSSCGCQKPDHHKADWWHQLDERSESGRLAAHASITFTAKQSNAPPATGKRNREAEYKRDEKCIVGAEGRERAAAEHHGAGCEHPQKDVSRGGHGGPQYVKIHLDSTQPSWRCDLRVRFWGCPGALRPES